MKKILYILGLAVVLAVTGGCERLEIQNIDPEADNGSSSGNETTELADPGLAWSASSYTATIGGENSFPTLSNENNVAVQFSSSDKSVATISSDGTITLLTSGTTSIMATSEATDTYSSGSASYALTVNKGSGSISWSASTCTVNIDEDSHTYPSLNNPGNQSITYSSSNEGVAAIDAESGEITLLAQGETTIVATATANESYEASSASYTLLVEGDLASAGLSWSAGSFTATMAADNSFPELSNPNQLTISYSSSDTSIATVDGNTGIVSLVGAGTTSIIATSEATDTHAAGSAAYTLKVVKHDVNLSWSQDHFTVVLEDGADSFPTLSVDPSDAALPISYSSSNTAVATVSGDGAVTLLAAGITVISAVFEGNETYKSASATYTLTVKSNADDGIFSGSFNSAGDSSSDDDISNTTFTRIVTVTYASGGAAVAGYNAVADDFDVSVNGNQVTITYTGSENVVYKLTGTAANGFFKLYSTKKQALWLSALSLASSSGAAINNQSGKRTFVYVDGANTLSDSSSAAYSTSGDEDMKGVFFSEGQLIFSGPASGTNTLTVTANNAQGKSGIVSDDYVRMLKNARVTVTVGSSAGHGVRGKEYVRLSEGTLSVTTKAAMKKGITSDGYVLVEGGATTVNVSGGVAYDSDDAEYTGTAGVKADNYFGMTGGSLTITNTGSGGKGIRAGSYDYASGSLDDSYISGGTLTITTSGSESNDVSSKAIKIGYKEKVSGSYKYGGNLLVKGGTTVVNCAKSEAVEVKGKLTISGGELYVSSTGDDAINSQGELNITGGYVYGYATQNDAIDTNCDFKISGGYVFAVTTKGAPEVALDANTEGGYKLYINSGATVVAYGGLESGYSASQNVYSMSCTAGGWNALGDGSSYIAAFKAPSGVSSVAVSAPSLSKGYTGVTVGGSTLCNGI